MERADPASRDPFLDPSTQPEPFAPWNAPDPEEDPAPIPAPEDVNDDPDDDRHDPDAYPYPDPNDEQAAACADRKIEQQSRPDPDDGHFDLEAAIERAELRNYSDDR